MKKYKIYNSDIIESLKLLEPNSISAVVTDPPYHLTSNKNAKGGFMGAKWDGGDITFRPSTWAEVLRVVKPGGILLAFGGTRKFHRLACAIEDAGWELKDCIAWMSGQGFPKAMDIAKSIDKCKKGHPQGTSDPDSPNSGKFKSGISAESPLGQQHGAGPGQWMKEKGVKDTRTLCEEAKPWIGYKTSLKPAWEPILFCMKPLEGTYAENAQKWGVAGVNVDAIRITTTDDLNGGAYTKDGKERYDGYDNWRFKREGKAGEFKQPKGRFPSNVVLSHHPDCVCKGEKKIKAVKGGGGLKKKDAHIFGKYSGHEYPDTVGYFDKDGMETIEDWDCHEECPIRILNEQTGNLKGGAYVGRNRDDTEVGNRIYGTFHKDTRDVSYGDKGGASRFFYCAKASRRERNEGCEHLYWEKDGKEFKIISKEKWETLEKSQKAQGNIHLTVKPQKIMEWLCRMLKMPEPTTILDPFMGSGSTGIAAIQEGFNFIGFDSDPIAAIIAEARLKHASSND